MSREQTELTVIERFDGRGRIYDGERLVDEVTYALKLFEELPSELYPGGQNARDVELRSLAGIVTPSRIEVLAPYVGTRLVFELRDGRRFDFTVARTGETYCLIKALTLPPR